MYHRSSISVIIDRSFDGFLEFAADFHLPQEDGALATCICEWLWSGDGPVECYGDFEVYLKVIPLIVEAYYCDPSILNFQGNDDTPASERRVPTAFNGDTLTHSIFTREFFDAAYFGWKQQRNR